MLDRVWRKLNPLTLLVGMQTSTVTMENRVTAAAAKSLQSCPTVQPHRRQPTSLTRPWDSPGKNTGAGCHFLLQCRKVNRESEVAHSCLTLRHLRDCSPPGSSVHGIFQARVLEWGAIAFSHIQHCVNLRYTMWWFDTYGCCQMFTTISLANKSFTSH